MMQLYIESVGIYGSGMQDWESAKGILNSKHPIDPDVSPAIPPITLLPANEKRRATKTIKVALHCLQQLFPGAGIENLPHTAVFSSCSGDPDLVQSICTSLAAPEKTVSPTHFHNSVHNAPAGYWSIATGCMLETNSLSAGRATFTAGLLEAYTLLMESGNPVVYCCYDVLSREPLVQIRPVYHDFGCALLVTDKQSQYTLAKLSLELKSGNKTTTRMKNKSLEQIRKNNPSAAALPLLAALAARKNATVILPYLDDQYLSIQLSFRESVNQSQNSIRK